MCDGISSGYFYSGDRGGHPLCDSRLFEYTSWETLRCGVLRDSGHCVRLLARGCGEKPRWVAYCLEQRQESSVLQVNIDTVMNAKFGECAYTFKTFKIH